MEGHVVYLILILTLYNVTGGWQRANDHRHLNELHRIAHTFIQNNNNNHFYIFRASVHQHDTHTVA